jgi:hypothetical protein
MSSYISSIKDYVISSAAYNNASSVIKKLNGYSFTEVTSKVTDVKNKVCSYFPSLEKVKSFAKPVLDALSTVFKKAFTFAKDTSKKTWTHLCTAGNGLHSTFNKISSYFSKRN